MKALTPLITWPLRFVVLYVLALACFVTGASAVAARLPENAPSEPGLVSPVIGLLIIALVNVIVVTALVLTSRWSGRTLAAALAIAYYGAVTVLTQIETWYFLSSITVSADLLPRLFLMGVPTAFVFVPLAVWILGRWRPGHRTGPVFLPVLSPRQWAWILPTVALVYVLLYWTAGYVIAWQNPSLRAFYGRPGQALPFIAHTAATLRDDPLLLPFQVLRSFLWTLCGLPIVFGSRVNVWWTALLVGVLFSVPQNVGHIIANPLMPIASVRLSHLIETASSTFVFGVIVVWLLHRASRADNGQRTVPAAPA